MNWNLPELTDLYTNWLAYLKDRDLDLAKGLDPASVTVTNPVAGMIRWNSVNGYDEIFNGTTWGAKAATYNINVANLGGAAAAAYARLSGPVFTDAPAGPTAAVGTNTTQLATTAFVLANSFPTGTRMTFQQTAAPTGWTKETNAAYNDAALRVVTGTASTGGTAAFATAFAARTIAEANLPAHTHNGTTGNQSADHTHTFTTGAESVGHTHTINMRVGAGGGGTGLQTADAISGETPTGRAETANISSGHTHNGTTNGAAQSHNHTFTTSSIGSGTAMDFAVKYADVIIATKD